MDTEELKQLQGLVDIVTGEACWTRTPRTMTQRRNMGPPGSKPPERRYGLLGATPKLDSFGPGLGTKDLLARGWTLKLIKKFLGNEDRRDLFKHWASFSGKKVYLVARVELAEAMPEFEVDFIISARWRNLPRDYVDVVIARCKGFRQRI